MPVIDVPGQASAAQRGNLALTGAAVRYGLTLLYCVALCHAYDVMSHWWAYFGFTYKLNSGSARIVACLLASLPVLLLPAQARTFAQAAAWFLYMLVFIPALLVPVMQFALGWDHLIWLYAATWIGCVLFLIVARGDVTRARPLAVSPRLFWGTLLTTWSLMLLVVLISFGGTLNFVGADNIYDQRYIGADAASNPIVRYSIALLTTAINPFLMAYGLFSKRWLLVLAGIAAQIFLFGTLAAKAVLLSPIFVIGAYFLSIRDRAMYGTALLVGLLTIFVLSFPSLMTYNPLGGAADQIISLLYLRTFLIAGATMGIYDQFFSIVPNTFFSNNNLVGLFIPYPFGDLSVGQVVQQMLMPVSGPDIPELNASFLATDGIAALGLAGIPVVATALALILRLMSRYVARERTMLMVSGGTGFILSLANNSFLTSLVTGGGLLFLLLVHLVPAEPARS